MTGNDDSILEILATLPSDFVVPPKTLHVNLERHGISISYRTVRRRLRILEERGLVDKYETEKAYYRLSDKGRAYLRAEIEASDLEDDEGETESDER